MKSQALKIDILHWLQLALYDLVESWLALHPRRPAPMVRISHSFERLEKSCRRAPAQALVQRLR